MSKGCLLRWRGLPNVVYALMMAIKWFYLTARKQVSLQV